jgi:superfamily II DNA or RNA helicase
MPPSRFVDRLRRERGDGAARGDARGQRLHYVVGPGEHHLWLSLRVGQVQPNGRLAEAQAYRLQPAHLAQPPAFLDADDVSLLEALSRAAPAWLGACDGELPTAIGTDWLERMVATGRARDDAGRTVARAAPVACDCAWVIDGQARQHLVWQLPADARGVAAVPPAFWDGARAQIAAIDCPYPAEARAWIASGQWVDPEHVADFRARHDATLTAWGLPRPIEVPMRTPVPPPEPVLYLVGAADGAPGERLRLRLRYGDGASATVFDYSEPDLHRRVYDPAAGMCVVIERAAHQEAELAQRLRATVAPHRPREDRPGELAFPGSAEWQRVMLEAVPALERAGWPVDTAPGFRYRFVRAREINLAADWLDRDWLELALQVEVDGETIPLLPLLAACRQRYTLAELQAADPTAEYPLELADGRRLLLPAYRLARWLAVLDELDDGDERCQRLRLPAAQVDRLAQLDDGDLRTDEAAELLNEAQARRASAEAVARVPTSGRYAALRAYQRLGVAWLQQRQRLGTGGILADDMGLGKTRQILAHIALEREHGRLTHPALVVAPTSVLAAWPAEAARFCPELSVCLLHGPGRHRDWSQANAYDVLVTSYSLVARDQARWQQQPLSMAVLDEAQAIRNPRAQASRCVRTLDAPVRFCLTGTPLQNHLGELWALFDCLMPGALGSERRFNRRYRRPIEDDGDDQRRAALMERIAPFVLRRRKEEVATELPDKSEVTLRLPLNDAQRSLYEHLRERAVEQLRASEASAGHQDPVHVLNVLMQLRQLCCEPALIDPERHAETGSAKRDYLRSMVAELVGEGRTLLVFSQFRAMLERIGDDLAATGIEYLTLTGDTTDRADRIERFQRGDAPVFLISLKAGGTGLNLTRADTVIHYDPWWNAAAEDQATDRAHRIGQDRPVFVYRLLAQDTVEEKVHALQQRKHDLLSQVYRAAETESARLPRDPEALVALLET